MMNSSLHAREENCIDMNDKIDSSGQLRKRFLFDSMIKLVPLHVIVYSKRSPYLDDEGVLSDSRTHCNRWSLLDITPAHIASMGLTC